MELRRTRFTAATATVLTVALAVLLVVGPASVAEAQDPTDEDIPVGDPDPPTDPALTEEDTGAPAQEEERKIQIAQTPRDQVGLIFLGALLVGGGLAVVNARRQLRGERPQATGEFRWR